MEFEVKVLKSVKTYSRSPKTAKNYVDVLHEPGNANETLTCKDAASFLLSGTLRLRVCRYCLNVEENLSELDEIIVIAGKAGLYEVTIKDVIATFFPVKVAVDPNFPNKVCKKCLDQALTCYLFAQQCEQSERALRNYFEDMDEKFDKLDPLEPVKKRGKRKLNPNHNVLYTEHLNVIDYAEPIINLVNLNALPQEASEVNDLECSKCWQVLPNKISLLNHEKSHPKSMWYNCKHCGKSFVKFYQLKKHKRLSHGRETELETPDMAFKCSKCGVQNKIMEKHLLHIEKHKFQQSLDNLLKRNTSNMCSVCLSEENDMTDLKETMHLHGGYPSLTGPKSIFNMVSSVFPDPKKCKYQELLVPNQPTILRLLKRKIEAKCNSQKVIFNSMDTQETKTNLEIIKRYVFSKPDIITLYSYITMKDIKNADELPTTSTNRSVDTETITKNIKSPISNTTKSNEKTDISRTVKPIGIKDVRETADTLSTIKNIKMIETESTTENDKAVKLNTASEKDIKEISFATDIKTNNRNSIETGSDFEYFDITHEVKNNLAKCKICWIFKTPTCPSCKEIFKMETANQNDYSISMLKDQRLEKTCKYCYMFSKVGQCEFCKQITDKPDNAKTTNNEDNIKLNLVTNLSKWQCKICHTKNTNRELCICCDAANFNKDIKIIFDKSFQTSFERREDKTIIDDDAKEIIEAASTETEVLSAKVPSHIPNVQDEIKLEIFSTHALNKTSEIHLMEIEEIPQNTEFMDVVFDEENQPKEINNQQEILVFPTNKFEIENMEEVCNNEHLNTNSNNSVLQKAFNIGTGFSERKRKKPLRRMAAMLRK